MYIYLPRNKMKKKKIDRGKANIYVCVCVGGWGVMYACVYVGVCVCVFALTHV